MPESGVGLPKRRVGTRPRIWEYITYLKAMAPNSLRDLCLRFFRLLPSAIGLVQFGNDFFQGLLFPVPSLGLFLPMNDANPIRIVPFVKIDNHNSPLVTDDRITIAIGRMTAAHVGCIVLLSPPVHSPDFLCGPSLPHVGGVPVAVKVDPSQSVRDHGPAVPTTSR